MTTDLASRVDAGARLLDEKRPGWHPEIAMDSLAMDSCDRCILGQMFGHYIEGKYDLEIDSGVPFGFCETHELDGEEWEPLADLWRAEIHKRLEAES